MKRNVFMLLDSLLPPLPLLSLSTCSVLPSYIMKHSLPPALQTLCRKREVLNRCPAPPEEEEEDENNPADREEVSDLLHFWQTVLRRARKETKIQKKTEMLECSFLNVYISDSSLQRLKPCRIQQTHVSSAAFIALLHFTWCFSTTEHHLLTSRLLRRERRAC